LKTYTTNPYQTAFAPALVSLFTITINDENFVINKKTQFLFKGSNHIIWVGGSYKNANNETVIVSRADIFIALQNLKKHIHSKKNIKMCSQSLPNPLSNPDFQSSSPILYLLSPQLFANP
jgi:hypothetical protein